jgi:hypothetical protein
MTWQRIDENTYIDDTLVTCAEYQLFIDEMREKGKYYQPDHWTSYQFPTGQAREPILGVRHSDAIAFCEWLTDRGDSGWKYRLPTRDEIATVSIKYEKKSPLGYWINEYHMHENILGQFVWIGSIPKDARRIDFLTAMEIDLNQYKMRNLAEKYIREIEKENAPELNQAPSRALDLDHYIDLAHVLDLGYTVDRNLDHAQASQLARDRYLHDEFTLDIRVDFFTLQERIVGHSPAFEGIRLVKELIK